MNKNPIKKYLLQYWYFYLIVFLSMMISIFLDMWAPIITQSIIDDVIVGGKIEVLMTLLFCLLGIGVGRAIFQYTKEFMCDKASIYIAKDMRKNLFRHIQKLSISYFDKNNTGELMARVRDDVDKVWNALGFVGMLIVECTVHTISVLYCMFHISPILTIAPLIIMPIVGYTAVKMENKLGQIYEKISEQNAELNTVAQENLAGVRTVKAFAREGYEIEKFARHNKQYYNLNMQQAKTLVRYNPNISFLTKLLLVLVIIFGGILVIQDVISIGELGAFTLYANNIIWPMELLGWLSNDFASAVASNKKINRILAEEPEICDPKKQKNALDHIKGDVEFQNVSFELNQTPILKNISFCVEKGKTLGIMGMTGSGKTSIVNLIERFYDVTDGAVKLDNQNIKDLPLETLRQNIAVVMQDVFLFSDTIKENICIGNRERINTETIHEAMDAARAKDFVERMTNQYDTVIGERGVGLSGGQKQRISIARAFAKKAPILILDDSTSALDMETEYEIQQRLSELKDTTKIIIAHRISAVKNADEILILRNGEVAERGTHTELMEKKGLYYATYEAQYGDYRAAAKGLEEC